MKYFPVLRCRWTAALAGEGSSLHCPVKCWAGFAQSEGRDAGALLTARYLK
jgi:hypothetical protein